MYVNAFYFGIMCTLFVEMALVILINLPKKKSRHEKKEKVMKPITLNYKEEENNGKDWIK